MSFILTLVCFIWLIFLQNKLTEISSKLDSMGPNNDKKVKMHDDFVESESKPAEVKDITHESVEEKSSSTVTDVESVAPASSVKYPFERQTKAVSSAKYSFERQSENSDLQSVFLGNIFNKIGALAIIIAVIIFIKLVSPFIVITPLMKVIFGFIAGLGMSGGALAMHSKEDLKKYSEVLLGTGFATLFITTFCAYSMFNIFNTAAVISVGAVLLLMTFVIAQRMKTASMLVIGLIGGYLTPVFSGAGYEVSLYYLLFLNLVSLIFTLKNKHYNVVNCINLVITMFVFLPYVVEPVKPLFPLLLWGIYIVYDILRDKTNKTDNILSIINYFVLALFSAVLYRSIHNYLGALLAFTAVVYGVLALKSSLYKYYVHFMLFNLWLSVFFLLSDVTSVFVWAAAATVLSYLIGKLKFKYLTGMYAWYLLTAVVGALLASHDGQFCMYAKYVPVINMRTLVFSFPIIASFISAYIFKNENDGKYVNLLVFNGVSLIYLYLTGEISSLLHSEAIELNRWMIYSILGFIYSVHLRFLYKSDNCDLFNIVSWLVYALSMMILLICGIDYHTSHGYLPVLNLKFAAYAFAILTSIILGREFKNDFFKYFAVFLGFLLVHGESVGIAYLHNSMSYIISLSWVLYSGVITVCGILSNKRYLINSGIAVIILTIFRIFIFDLAKVDALYKLIAFLALGIILMYVSYLYTTNQKNLK